MYYLTSSHFMVIMYSQDGDKDTMDQNLTVLTMEPKTPPKQPFSG
jgi:hypothetical protein